MIARLDCCRPTTQHPGGRLLVHSPICERVDVPLTRDEEREFFRRLRAERDHPSSGAYTPIPESWTVAHDRDFPTGCGRSACYRCDSADDDGPYADEVTFA